MKSSVRKNIRRWLILARGKFSPPRAELANFVLSIVLLSLLFLSIILAVPACKQPTSPDPKTDLSFTLEDASCTETWINIKAANYGSGFRFLLNRNDSTIMQFPSLPEDTTVGVKCLFILMSTEVS